jgi:uncharacterized protein
MPTEACNFRCVYCYETFQYKQMERWVVSGVKNLIRRRFEGLESLSIAWFGGEPLLAVDVIQEIMAYIHDLKGPLSSPTVQSDITTNGYLLSPSIATRLLDLGVTEYQISFDGPRDYHDQKRIRPGGLPTFDRVWSNLLRMREQSRTFEVMVRLHVDRENVVSIPRFLDEFEKEFGQDPRFVLFIRTLGRFGGPNDHLLPVFDPEAGAAAVKSLEAKAAGRGIRLKAAPRGIDICYAAKANSFLVRANGRINKCTMALDHPANQVGKLREDGGVELDRERLIPWMRGLRSADAKELACPMIGLASSARSRSPGALPLLNVSPGGPESTSSIAVARG